jgi:type IV pilus assembly protein PilQ
LCTSALALSEGFGKGKIDTSIIAENVSSFPIDSNAIVPQLDFRNADLRDIFDALAKTYNLNIWIDDKVQGKTTLHLVNVSLNSVFEFLAEQNQLIYEKSGNIIKVYKAPLPPPEPLKISYSLGFLSVDLKDADLEEVVRTLVKQSKENIVIESGVTGRINGTLEAIEFEKGLKALMISNGFVVRKIEGVYHIDRLPTEQQAPTFRGAYSVSYKDDKLNIDVSNAQISNLVRQIAEMAKLDIFVYVDLQGQISAKCEGLTVDQSLAYLLKTTDYTFRKDKGIYLFGKKDQEGMLVTELLELQHLSADTVATLLPQELASKATVKFIKEQNGLMLIGPYNVVEGIKDFVREIDFPPAQILIEALVVDFTKTSSYDYGIFANNFGLRDTTNIREYYYPDIQIYTHGKEIQDKWLPRLGIKGVGKIPENFWVQLHALARQGKANIRSRPQIATLNGHKATFNVGTTQYYLLKTETVYASGQPTVSTQVSERFQTIEASMSLTVVPRVTAAGDIIVEIHPEFNTPSGQFDPNIPPTINHRILDATVRLHDGETIVLGGLIQTIEEESIQKFPILGDIPLIKYLFRNKTKSKTDAELVIYLTPYVYYGSEGAVDVSKYKK